MSSQEAHIDGLNSTAAPWDESEETHRHAQNSMREEREARILMYNIERQLKKMEEMKGK